MFKLSLINIELVYLFILPCMASRCTGTSNQMVPMYRLFKEYSRSMETILIQRQLDSLEKCRDFAISRKALAFNFNANSNGNRNHDNNQNHADNRSYSNNYENYKKNCQVLECPEINAFTSLVEDNDFNYYSMYSHKILPENSSNTNYSLICLPSVGLFILSKLHKNYSEGQAICNKMHGVLAHIVSPERTQGLAKFINMPAYVGLSNKGRVRVWKNEFDEPLSCFDYRGWAKGEPASSHGCATLFQEKKNLPGLQSFWKVVSCSRMLPFICEILPDRKAMNQTSTLN